MTAVQEARHEDFVDPHLEGFVGEALDDLESRVPGSVSSAEELVHKAKLVLRRVEREADADMAHISAQKTDRLTSFVDQGVYRWILDPAGREDAKAVEAAKSPDELTGTARANWLTFLGDSDSPREAFAMYRIRYQQLAQLSDALLEKYPEAATELPLDGAGSDSTPLANGNGHELANTEQKELSEAKVKQSPEVEPEPEPAQEPVVYTSETPKAAETPEEPAKTPLALMPAPEKPIEPAKKAEKPQPDNIIPSSGKPIALPGPATAPKIEDANVDDVVTAKPARQSFRLEHDDLIRTDKIGRALRPNGKRMSRAEEEVVLSREAQIRKGLKGWLAENKLVVLDDQNYARDPETGKRLTNAQLLELSKTADFSREAFNGRAIEQGDVSKDWKDLTKAERDAILANQAATIPVTNPSRKGLRSRLRKIMTQAHYELVNAPATAASVVASAANKARNYYGDQETKRRRIIGTVVGAGAVFAAGVTIYALNRSGQNGHEVVHGLSTGPKGVPGSGAELLDTTPKGGSGHSREVLDALGVKPSAGSGATATNKEVLDALGVKPSAGQGIQATNNEVVEALTGNGNRQGGKEAITEVFTLKAPEGGVHDSISRQMLDIAAQNDVQIDPSSAHFADMVNQTLDFNHLTAAQAEQLPVGYEFRLPPAVIAELTKLQ